MSQPIRDQGGHLVFPIGPKNTNLVDDVVILLPVKFRWIPLQRFQRRHLKCLNQSEARAAILFFRLARKTQTWWRTLISCFLSSFVEFRSAVLEWKSKMSQPNRGKGGHLVFPIGRKHKFGRGRWDLASCQVSLNSVQRFHRSGKCFSQSEARAAILFFRLARKTLTWWGHWDLASCQVSLNSVQRFQSRSRKCLSQSEARAAILFFWSARKTQTW